MPCEKAYTAVFLSFSKIKRLFLIAHIRTYACSLITRFDTYSFTQAPASLATFRVVTLAVFEIVDAPE